MVASASDPVRVSDPTSVSQAPVAGPAPVLDPESVPPAPARTPVITTRRLSDLHVGPAPGPASGLWRAAQHVLTLVTAGTGNQMIDFVWYPCRPGTLLWGRPGQVHQFGYQPGLDAVLLFFPSSVLADLALDWDTLDPHAPTHWQPTGEDEDAIVAEVAQIETDTARYARGGLPERLLVHQLAVLLTRIMALAPVDGPAAGRTDAPPGGRLARPVSNPVAAAANGPAPGAATGAGKLVHKLRAEMERDLRHRPVEWYAGRLGCSVRTLTRACLAMTGQGAKQLVDERLALEAKRLLATTTLPATVVGQRLGFSEATNFGRFFSRETGQAPGAFRASLDQQPANAVVGGAHSALPGRLRPLADQAGSSPGAIER